MDRISHLPDFIVHHILSFLNTRYDLPKELVRMSVLSKTWFHLTATFPILDFNIHYFGYRERFFKYVDYTTSRFCRQNLTARRLTLITTIHEPTELDVVTRCLELVLKNGVEELVIDVTDSPDSLKYRLPNTLLSVSVLKLLNISGCELPSSLLVDVVRFKSLIVLKLRGVNIDDEVIKCLSISCPLLQTLVIIKCIGLNSFCVSRHQSLRCVRIDYNTPVKRIDIEAPNLSYLDVTNTNKEGAPQMKLASCQRLANVSYGSCAPLLRNLNRFTDFLSNFPFVENFRLMAPSKGNSLKLSSHSLRRLMVHSVCNLEDIELNTSNLELFVYSCSLLDLSMVRNLAHLKASMQCYPHDSADTLWFHKLRLFLGK
ncbi:F-box/LRR-repeat protein 25-like [Bidens hawaiensis]|uniref:F-box/LRR-repeat protein 25-like n=1 Tax=Bidens hawaiensis TaxID=980011 RepID=UPI0040493773